jgi:hypothetical protein
MRNVLWIFLLVIGCSGRHAAVSEDSPNPDGVSPAGDGGLVEGNDGGLDGGALDGGLDGGLPDGGTQCVNTIESVPLEPRSHIPEDSTPVYLTNPPVSGEHYPIWARWQSYTVTVPRGYWVHNLEHGGVIYLYRPDAPQSLVDSLTRVYNAIPNDSPCDHPRAILTPDPLLDVPWAVTVSGPEDIGFGYRIKADCIESEDALVRFAVEHRNQSIESFCDDGAYPP